MGITSLTWTRRESSCCAHRLKVILSASVRSLHPPDLLSAPRKNTREMIDVVPPFRSVFHPQRSVPASNVLSGTKTSATTPQPASHNPYSNHPINTTDGCYKVRSFAHSPLYDSLLIINSHQNPLVIPGFSPCKRYQPYPQPQRLPPGQLLIFGNRESAKRHGLQSQLVDLYLGSGVVQSRASARTSHPEDGVDTTTAADLIPPSTGDCDVGVSRETQTLEANLMDVEMEDDFLPSTPTIVVSILLV